MGFRGKVIKEITFVDCTGHQRTILFYEKKAPVYKITGYRVRQRVLDKVLAL